MTDERGGMILKPNRRRIADFAREKLVELSAAGLYRQIVPTKRERDHHLIRGDRAVLSFCDNDYLGLAQHPVIKEAAAKAAIDHGAGAGGSRLVTGDHPLFTRFEEKIASFKGAQAAVCFGSGYMANIGTIPIFAGRNDLILIDRLAHACLYAGAQLSGAKVVRFKHNDVGDLNVRLDALRGKYRHALIIVDGVYSMDGDLAPLRSLQDAAKRHRAWLMVDDAHGLGVLGNGRGSCHEQGVMPDILMGTLSKALGSYGGYVAGNKPVVELIKNRARSLIYTTGLPPAAVAAALAALYLIENDPDLCARPLAHARRFCNGLYLPAPESAIVPLVIGTPQAALDAQAALERAGFLVVAIRPPTVPDGTARLRFSFSAAHKMADIDRLIETVKALGLVQ